MSSWSRPVLPFLVPPLAVLLLAASAGLPDPPPPPPPEDIDPASLMATVGELVRPEYGGRVSGGPGYLAAARWAADRFAALGLEPAGEDGFLQWLEVEWADVARCSLRVAGEPLALGEDFACRGFTGSGQVDAEVVFVGYGISRPDLGFDEYAGVDVAGKVVLAFKEDPPWTLGDTPWGEANLPRPKAETARAHGAVALVLVGRDRDGRVQFPIASVLHGPGPRPDIPALQVSGAVARRLVPDLRERQARLDEGRAVGSGPTGQRVTLDVAATYDPSRWTPNVVARLPGTAGDGVVVVSAHLDHVGRQGAVTWPGANDNASGVAAVLAVAETLARAPVPPRRDVVFVLYAAEESGLLGSRHFAGTVDPARVVAQLNLDCVGHGDALQLGGGGASPGLWGLARRLDAAGPARTVEATWHGGGADAQALFDLGVPTLYFATTNSYTHLHRPTDTPETLDPVLLRDTAWLAAAVARELAWGDAPREARAAAP